MRKLLLILILLSAGCTAEQGTLTARCNGDGTCAGRLVCIHRTAQDKYPNNFIYHEYLCVLPEEVSCGRR